MSDKLKIIVAAHKPYWMPADSVYLPLHVGAEGKYDIGFEKDNTGDNISSKNPYYCELTGMYWAWKNIDADYVGLVHYRRHFSNKGLFRAKQKSIMNGNDYLKYLERYPIILPKPRNYFIETNYSQFVHAHSAIYLDKAREIISEKYPEYLVAFDKSMKFTKGHRFNMFVMEKSLFCEYSEWLFDILFSMEAYFNSKGISEDRIYGFVSERLLDIWVNTKGISYCELPYAFLEKQNWIKKIISFLMRKIKGRA